jgi:hypothetical protein
MDCLHDRFLASEIRRQRVCGRQAGRSPDSNSKPKGGTASPRACIFAPFIETRNIKASFLRLWAALILSRATGRADFPADFPEVRPNSSVYRTRKTKPDVRPVASWRRTLCFASDRGNVD